MLDHRCLGPLCRFSFRVGSYWCKFERSCVKLSTRWQKELFADFLIVLRIGPIWQQHRLLNDQLFYRYAYDFDRAFRHFSCTLCSSVRDSRLVEEQADSLLLFVGVYSAQDNFAKRAVIRRTWGRVFQLYGHVKFFLGRPDERFATQVRAWCFWMFRKATSGTP